MTSLGDLCACGDLALPGQDLCSGCLADRQVERAAVVRDVAVRTAEHEALVEAQETS